MTARTGLPASDRAESVHARYTRRSACLAWLWVGLILCCPSSLALDGPRVHGQLSGWLDVAEADGMRMASGLRYHPRLLAHQRIGARIEVDIAAALDARMAIRRAAERAAIRHGETEVHRLWFRIAADRWEVRFGRQKISFGSASLVRPLMWFDRTDARDPLQVTAGVDAVLMRCYFMGNANLWIWGLLGSDAPRGWDLLPSDPDIPELGGRLQLPFAGAELAVSYHERRSVLALPPVPSLPNRQTYRERRVGCDARWDWTLGLWVEAAGVHQTPRGDALAAWPGIADLPKWQRSLNTGCDYTFDWGNGLTVLAEHFILETAETWTGSGEGLRLSACSWQYPLGLLDRLQAMVYYDWGHERFYRTASWVRLYDRIGLHAIVYWNPEQDDIYRATDRVGDLRGRGLQLLVTYDH